MPVRKGSPTRSTTSGARKKGKGRGGKDGGSGRSGHRITLRQAAALTRRHREWAGPATEKGGMFTRELLDRLLAQPGCLALRYYHGRHADGRYAMVLVGVDAKGNDMERGVLLENHFPCPPICGGDGELNS